MSSAAVSVEDLYEVAGSQASGSIVIVLLFGRGGGGYEGGGPLGLGD